MDHQDNLRRIVDFNDANPTLKIATKPLISSKYKCSKTLAIQPEEDDWDFRWLSVFINQLNNYQLDPKNGCRSRFNVNKEVYHFFRFISRNNQREEFILIDIQDKIDVRVSKKIADGWDDENIQASWTKKIFYIILNSGSIALLKDSPLIYYPPSEFSPAFHSFCSSFVSMKIKERTPETIQIYEYIDNFRQERFYTQFTFNRLKKANEGYLSLNLSEFNNTKKVLDQLEVDGKKYFILGGTFISPWAPSLIQGGKASGIILDTTWNLLQHYVCSLPSLVVFNVGIPIGFTFSLVEDASIYKDFFAIFENSFGFRINDYINVAISDQGVPLKSAIIDLNMHHLFCLRHVMVNLKKTPFSEQIGNLISATCKYDFDSLVDLYTTKWKEIVDEKKIKQLKNTLKKVGLIFDGQTIKVDKQKRWESVSMLYRAKYSMPSCTNQLESTHGQMNSSIPRRNSIWPSIERIMHAIMKKNRDFSSHFDHNYQYYKAKIRRICKSTPNSLMEKMIKQYHTNLINNTCDCGESCLLSSMFKKSIPCSHLFYMGVQFPDLSAPDLNLINSIKGELVVEYNFVKSEQINLNVDYYSNIKKHAVKIIQKYSHFKKDKIIDYVDKKLTFDTEPNEFILGYPIEVFDVIDEGIRYFKA